MRILTWNIRGLGSKLKVSAVNKIIRDNKVEMAFLQETKKESFSEQEVGRLWFDDDFEFQFAKATGRSGGVLTIWDKKKFEAEKSLVASRYVIISGKWVDDNCYFTFINIYAPCEKLGKQLLWDEIVTLRSSWQYPWIMGGDFNAIRARKERKGSGVKYPGIEDFNSFIEKCKLLEIPLCGRNFT
ncbi:hypothetical protein like AT4G29090 [Hibiscus trionum]|uniref:Endonuclease/exonuclease/phosphatase domain-containing protein n=1 Tax=Hibiscus trionum TaxID=183268 RepID=A0A9W7IQ25_HIBTR|nr:hypothetical protein like AT4G29090 [Hibiscus trionum]